MGLFNDLKAHTRQRAPLVGALQAGIHYSSYSLPRFSPSCLPAKIWPESDRTVKLLLSSMGAIPGEAAKLEAAIKESIIQAKTVFSTLLAGLTLALATVNLSQPARAQLAPDQSKLTMTITPDTFPENGGVAAATGTVTRNTTAVNPYANPLVVNLISTDTSEARVPATVTIPAGAAAASFPIAAVMDNQVDGTRVLHIEATAPGFTAVSVRIAVTDVTPPALRVQIKHFAAQATANAAGNVDTGVVSRNTVLEEAQAQPLVVTLQSTNPAQATVPATVTIPAGALSVEFPITILDDKVVDGTQRFQIVATATGFVEARASMATLDSDKPVLTMKANVATFAATAGANAATVTITRNAQTQRALIVTLTSTDTSVARVPATVTIPAGQTSVTFPVSAVASKSKKASRPVHIVANAPGFTKDEILFTVTP